MSSKKHILLTGSTGFLGKHISKAFIEANYSVTPLHLKRNKNNKICNKYTRSTHECIYICTEYGLSYIHQKSNFLKK